MKLKPTMHLGKRLKQIGMNDKLLTTLNDRAAIIQLIDAFGMAIDLRTWEKFESLFHNPTEFDYSSIGVIAGNLQPYEIVNTARHDLSGFQATQHQITNHQVEIIGDTATCTAHVRAMHYLPNTQGNSTFEMGGYYTVGLIRTPSNWKIQRWKFSMLWSHGNQNLFELAASENLKREQT
ncbi:hypothetical protein NIES4071_34990 [Calothrix sp. NIES-4071]|nr:hypothetical protein NIES4071_34990 [Calothrix sp. NIES-4071]BAZ57818.1 hypothetical protein NIES4105_34920 [Calothrix sp. NIES-4105]